MGNLRNYLTKGMVVGGMVTAACWGCRIILDYFGNPWATDAAVVPIVILPEGGDDDGTQQT